MKISESFIKDIIESEFSDNYQYVIITIFHANKAYDMDDKLLNCKVEDWELEWNTLLNIYLANDAQIKGAKPCLK